MSLPHPSLLHTLSDFPLLVPAGKMQLTPEQHRFELLGSTYTRFLSSMHTVVLRGLQVRVAGTEADYRVVLRLHCAEGWRPNSGVAQGSAVVTIG